MSYQNEDGIEYDKKSYCGCCGAEYLRLNGAIVSGECYTDCIWYDGEDDHNENPH